MVDRLANEEREKRRFEKGSREGIIEKRETKQQFEELERLPFYIVF